MAHWRGSQFPFRSWRRYRTCMHLYLQAVCPLESHLPVSESRISEKRHNQYLRSQNLNDFAQLSDVMWRSANQSNREDSRAATLFYCPIFCSEESTLVFATKRTVAVQSTSSGLVEKLVHSCQGNGQAVRGDDNCQYLDLTTSCAECRLTAFRSRARRAGSLTREHTSATT